MKNLPVPKKLKFLKSSLTLIDEESVPVDKEKLVTFTLSRKQQQQEEAVRMQPTRTSWRLSVSKKEQLGNSLPFLGNLRKYGGRTV